MIRPLKITVAALAVSALLTGVAYAAPRAVPQLEATALQNPDHQTLPGDMGALEQRLAPNGPVRYKLLVIESNDGYDKTDYIDRVAATWGEPAPDTLLLVLYTADNYDLRFYMGANFRQQGVTVDEMLQLVRTQYFATKRESGDVAGALVKLIEAVNARMGANPAGAATKEPVTSGFAVPDPFGGTRQTAAGDLKIVTGLLTAYLEQFKDPAIADSSRLQAFRWDDNVLVPVYSSETEIEFSIEYDVRPTSPNSDWMAGNGVMGEGGWILSKRQFMTVEREGAQWLLKGLATSPKPR